MKTSEPTAEFHRTLELLVDLLLPYVSRHSLNGEIHAETNSSSAQAKD